MNNRRVRIVTVALLAACLYVAGSLALASARGDVAVVKRHVWTGYQSLLYFDGRNEGERTVRATFEVRSDRYSRQYSEQHVIPARSAVNVLQIRSEDEIFYSVTCIRAVYVD